MVKSCPLYDRPDVPFVIISHTENNVSFRAMDVPFTVSVNMILPVKINKGQGHLVAMVTYYRCDILLITIYGQCPHFRFSHETCLTLFSPIQLKLGPHFSVHFKSPPTPARYSPTPL